MCLFEGEEGRKRRHGQRKKEGDYERKMGGRQGGCREANASLRTKGRVKSGRSTNILEEYLPRMGVYYESSSSRLWKVDKLHCCFCCIEEVSKPEMRSLLKSSALHTFLPSTCTCCTSSALRHNEFIPRLLVHSGTHIRYTSGLDICHDEGKNVNIGHKGVPRMREILLWKPREGYLDNKLSSQKKAVEICQSESNWPIANTPSAPFQAASLPRITKSGWPTPVLKGNKRAAARNPSSSEPRITRANLPSPRG